MNPLIGKRCLITTDNFFVAPDGEQYRAAFGTVHAVETDAEALGIQTDRGSTNWYVHIGNMRIAGCQIHYVIEANRAVKTPPWRDIEHEGHLTAQRVKTPLIYDADDEQWTA